MKKKVKKVRQKPKTAVKKLSYKQKAILLELSKRVKAPRFILEEFCFDKQLDFIKDPAKFKAAVCSRRSGKCRIEGTLVKTPTGSVPIEKLRPGDKVYGYNTDGSVTITTVTALWDQGKKDVVDLIHNRQIIATSTLDHKWLAHNTHKNKRNVKRLKDFNSRDRIAEEYIPIPGGSKNVPEAYAIGALLGDGCSTCSGIVISSSEEAVVQKVTKSLGLNSYKKNNSNNFNWQIHTETNGVKYVNSLYNEWCRNKKAHEKITDLTEIRSWDRASQVEFISGLIDSDGCVHNTKDGRVTIRLQMQSKSVIDTVSALILDLWQTQVKRTVDNRKKYKNGPVYGLTISNNKYSKRILKELKTVVESKQYKPEYDLLNERNSNRKYTGFKLSKPYKAQCWDITVDNDTHLFLDANGLIGHNTVACAADLIDTALKHPEVVCLYITLSRNNAKKIIWPELKRINKTYKMGGEVNESDLSMTFKNGSVIYISGAKDATAIENFRGLALKKVYIDEAQAFKAYIKNLIDEIIVPALYDHDGSLILIGTPGPVAAGTFYEASNGKGWSKHHWTMLDNPWIKKKSGKEPMEIIKAELERRGIDESDPTHQRENLGLWVNDLNALVFKFNPSINHFDTLPDVDFNYIFGIDLGHEDADAIAVVAYSHEHKVAYVVEEFVKNKQDISELAGEIKRLEVKYKPVKMVIDTGGLGKKIAEELRNRFQLNVTAAEKTRKLEFIELFNDALRTSTVKFTKESIAAQDYTLIQWTYKNNKRIISDVFHSDIADAVLYAWREAKNYIQIDKPVKPKPETKEAVDLWEMEEDAKILEAKNKSWWESY